MPEPISVPLSERPCPFITFYSFKGGVGRSMAVINVAGILAARGFRVLVVDMDLEAPGLSFLANQKAADADAKPSQPGFVDLLLDAVERGPDGDLFCLPAPAVFDRYSAPYELPEEFRQNPDGILHIMPAGRLDDDYSQRLERLDLPGLYQAGTGLPLILGFKQVVQDADRFDYVFIDSRTGFSDESGICTRDLPDCLIIVSGLNKQNVEGTASFLSTLRRSIDERKPLEVVLSPIPNGEDALVDARERVARAAFSEAWGAEVQTELHIPYHPQLALTEEPHIFRRRRGYLFDAYNRIEQSVLGLLQDNALDWFERGQGALKAKGYGRAKECLRRVNMVSSESNWAFSFMLGLDVDALSDPDVNVDALCEFVVERLSPSQRRHFAERVALMVKMRRGPEGNNDEIETLFRRAVHADPGHPGVLADYGLFLWREQKELNAADAAYQQGLDADPCFITTLWNYAAFLWHTGRDLNRAEVLFKRAFELDERSVPTLLNYGSFLLESGDGHKAGLMLERAMEVAPTDPTVLGHLAAFLWQERNDVDAAKELFGLALDRESSNVVNLANCGGMCVAIGQIGDGMRLINRALAYLPAKSGSHKELEAECWMYVYCCGAAERRPEALGQLRMLIELQSVKTGNWDFSGVIRQAVVLKHPEDAWLTPLADMLAGHSDPDALNDWAAWKDAAQEDLREPFQD